MQACSSLELICCVHLNEKDNTEHGVKGKQLTGMTLENKNQMK